MSDDIFDIYMLAVHYVVGDDLASDKKKKERKCKQVAKKLLSIIFFAVLPLFVQVFSLFFFGIDFAHPKCGVHTDCPAGAYCLANGRCTDCYHLVESNIDLLHETSNPSSMVHKPGLWLEYPSPDFGESCILDNFSGHLVIDYNNVSNSPTSQDKRMEISTFQESHASEASIVFPWHSHDRTSIPNGYKLNHVTDNSQNCRALHHCSKTDVMPLRCDYIEMNLEYLDKTSLFLLLVMSLLVATRISKDRNMAQRQKWYLEEKIEHQSKERMLHHILSAILTARQWLLPLFVVLAVVCTVISHPMKPGNIMLNMMSVVFVLEVDEQIAQLVIPPETRSTVTDLHGRYVKKEGKKWFMNFIFLLINIGLMFFDIYGMESIMRFLRFASVGQTFASTTGADLFISCDDIFAGILVVNMFIMFLFSLVNLIFDTECSVNKKVLNFFYGSVVTGVFVVIALICDGANLAVERLCPQFAGGFIILGIVSLICLWCCPFSDKGREDNGEEVPIAKSSVLDRRQDEEENGSTIRFEPAVEPTNSSETYDSAGLQDEEDNGSKGSE